jgi:hypothetical protein
LRFMPMSLVAQARKVEGWVLGSYMKRQGADLQFKLGVVWDLIREGAIQFYTGNPSCLSSPCVLCCQISCWLLCLGD